MNISAKMKSCMLRLLCCSLFLLPACWQASKQEGLFVINVLDADYYDDCHIKGSIHVTLDKLDEFVKNLDMQKAQVVFYCSNYMCTASGFAAQKLKDMGFQKVWAYEAGMAEWYQKGLPVYGVCNKSYLTKQIAEPELDQTRDISIISTNELAKMMHKID